MAISIEGFDLIRSLRDGDNDLFEEVVREYRAELLRHARRKMHDDSAAEDVVQETFTRAFRALGRLRDDSNIRPWLHHICANVCIDEANRRLRESDKVTRLHIDPLTVRELAPGIEDQLGLTIDDTPLQTALDSLSPEHRHALVLRFVDELEYDELAEQAGISEQNARARVSRARTMMRLALNGAAAIPLFLYGLLRRTPRASATLDRAEALPAAAPALSTTASVGHLGRLATAVAPAVEAAGAVAAAAPTAAPVLAKVAVGVGLVATATFATTGSESPAQRAAFTDGGPVAAVVVLDDAPAVLPSPADSAVAVGAGPDTSLAADAVVTVTTLTAAAGTDGAPSTGEQAAAAAPGGSSTGVDAAPSTVPSTTVAPTTTVVGAGGEIAVRGLAVEAAGPRLDLRGQATLTIGERTVDGLLSGRVSIATTADRLGRHRVDGTLALSFDGGSLQVRIAGFATVDPASVPDGTDDTTGTTDTSAPAPEASVPSAAPGGQNGGSATMSASAGDPATASTAPATAALDVSTRLATAVGAVPTYRVSGRFTTAGDTAGLLSAGSFSGRLSSADLTMTFGS